MSGSQILVLALNIVPWAVVGWFLSRSDDIRAEKAAKKRAVPVQARHEVGVAMPGSPEVFVDLGDEEVLVIDGHDVIDMSPAAARDLAERLIAATDELEAQ